MSQTQHCFTSYTIDEHPNPEAVFDWIRQHWETGEDELHEVVDTLKGFCDRLDLTLADWQISVVEDRGERIMITVPDDLTDMHGVRLWKYLGKHYGDLIAKDCPFTGVFYDEIALDPLRQFMKMPDNRTWSELADDCASALLDGLHDQYEWRISDECLREECEANEWEFYENGRVA
jgi:hypothetical protein